MRSIVSIFLLLISGHLVAQHSFSAGYSFAWITTGDMKGYSISNEYSYFFTERLYAGFGFDYTYSSAQGNERFMNNPTVVTQAGNYPFFKGINSQLVSEGWIVNPARTSKTLYRSLFLSVGYDVLNSSKHELSVAPGFLLSLQDKTYQTEILEGTFHSPMGEDDITLVVPLHVNYWDYGYKFSLNYSYQFTNVFGLGANVTGLFFGASKDRIYRGGIRAHFDF